MVSSAILCTQGNISKNMARTSRTCYTCVRFDREAHHLCEKTRTAGIYIMASNVSTDARRYDLLSGDSKPREASRANQVGFIILPLCKEMRVVGLIRWMLELTYIHRPS